MNNATKLQKLKEIKEQLGIKLVRQNALSANVSDEQREIGNLIKTIKATKGGPEALATAGITNTSGGRRKTRRSTKKRRSIRRKH